MSESDGKIGCAICGKRVHIIQLHLKEEHPELTLEAYTEKYPDEPVMSKKALERLEKNHRLRAESVEPPQEDEVVNKIGDYGLTKSPMHEVFELGRAKAALSHKGNPIPISVLNPPESLASYIPELDDNYIFNIEAVKNVIVGLEINIPIYVWGHMGTGKSTLIEQVCARTKRPMLRVQHTRNMEESHVLGQYLVKDGATVFSPGPLPFAMKHGLTLLLDEYDFATPAVSALYQPVLEGKPLVIKEADEENRIVRPHPLFRIIATGNTNGSGDETGLYQGTLIQNAANYDRFGIVFEMKWMDPKVEAAVVHAQAEIPESVALRLVEFAKLVRDRYADGGISLPISPRALINAGRLGWGRQNLQHGLELAYINRLPRVDQQVVGEVLRRVNLDVAA